MPTKMIRIRSAKPGFRRGGMAHSTEWKDYPVDRFTGEQLAQIRAEPRLLVEEYELFDEADAKVGAELDLSPAPAPEPESVPEPASEAKPQAKPATRGGKGHK